MLECFSLYQARQQEPEFGHLQFQNEQIALLFVLETV
jgi:hypothetical protein